MNDIYTPNSIQAQFDSFNSLHSWLKAMYGSSRGKATLMNAAHDLEHQRLPQSLLRHFFQLLARRWQEISSTNELSETGLAIKVFNTLLKGSSEDNLDDVCCQCQYGPELPYQCSRVMTWKSFIRRNLSESELRTKTGLPRLDVLPESDRTQIIMQHWHEVILPNAKMRAQRPFAWVTDTERLETLKQSLNKAELASKVRDALGLMSKYGYGTGEPLVEICYPHEDIGLKAPTFLDRTCEENVYLSVQKDDSWGRTVNSISYDESLREAVHPERNFTVNYELKDLGAPSDEAYPTCDNFLVRYGLPSLDEIIEIFRTRLFE